MIKILSAIFIVTLITSFSVNDVFGKTTIDVTKVFYAPEGTQPSGLAWHGGYLWLSSYIKNAGIYKINTSDGSVVVFSKPKVRMKGRYGGLAANQFSVFHLQANNGKNALEIKTPNGIVNREFIVKAGAINYSDMSVFENSLYVVGNNNALNGDDYRLYKIDYYGNVLNQIPFKQGTEIVQNHGLTSDGLSLWISSGDRLIRVNPESGIELESFPLPNNRIESLAWDGEFIWAASFNGDIYKIFVNK